MATICNDETKVQIFQQQWEKWEEGRKGGHGVNYRKFTESDCEVEVLDWRRNGRISTSVFFDDTVTDRVRKVTIRPTRDS